MLLHPGLIKGVIPEAGLRGSCPTPAICEWHSPRYIPALFTPFQSGVSEREASSCIRRHQAFALAPGRNERLRIRVVCVHVGLSTKSGLHVVIFTATLALYCGLHNATHKLMCGHRQKQPRHRDTPGTCAATLAQSSQTSRVHSRAWLFLQYIVIYLMKHDVSSLSIVSHRYLSLSIVVVIYRYLSSSIVICRHLSSYVVIYRYSSSHTKVEGFYMCGP